MTHRTGNRALTLLPGGASEANRLNREPLELLALEALARRRALRCIENEERARERSAEPSQLDWAAEHRGVRSPLSVAHALVDGQAAR